MVDGYVHPDFGGVTELLHKYTKGAKRHGGAIAVYHRGEKVVDAWAGTRDEIGSPWTEDTMAMSFSTTKGIASTALHVCADRGWVDYDEPVATYWPEFAAAGKERVTVRQLLTHSAGMHRLRGLLPEVDTVLDWDAVVAILAEQPADPPEGTGPGYHGLTYGWLVGEIVRRVSGQSLGTFVTNELAKPLELDGLHIGVPSAELPRVAPLLPIPDEKRRARAEKFALRMENWKFTKRLTEALLVDGLDEMIYLRGNELVQAEVPAMNGVFTARSLAKLYAAIANGGELDGTRILGDRQVRAMSERQLQADMRDYCIHINMKWRLGYHQGFTLKRNNEAYGHFGFGGSGAWADPEHQLSVAFVTNDLSKSSTPFADIRVVRLGTAALKAAQRR